MDRVNKAIESNAGGETEDQPLILLPFVLPVIGVLLIILIIVLCICWRRNRKSTSRTDEPIGLAGGTRPEMSSVIYHVEPKPENRSFYQDERPTKQAVRKAKQQASASMYGAIAEQASE